MIGLQSGDFANKPRPFADVRSEKKKLAAVGGYFLVVKVSHS